MVNVFIKNVDKDAYKMAKMIAAREERNIGQIVSESLRLLATTKKKKKGLLSIKPVSWGKGTEKLSQQIDEILYEGV
ncbi:MAG TPA: hypothetical protein VGQ00_01820 [Candidatus Norongarragalinales archaeon]|jgi:hypothetical protein|nr:hypothetical protein [Candidatus Norongarragalinales archaeon]